MFEDHLKDLRKKKGVTQAQVAEGIYVSRSLIAKFETGKAYPNKETLEKLALYFDVPVSELIDQDETTLVSIESKDISEKVNFIVLISILITAAIYSIIVFVPLLRGNRYIYPIPSGQNHPNRERFYVSIFWGTYEHGNPIGLLSFLLSLVVVGLSSLSLFLKQKNYSIFLRSVTFHRCYAWRKEECVLSVILMEK